ncbi:ribosome-associated translation inhibitor RaiA [Sphingosinicella sp. LHD-64]|uniref:ribosome hibernation-promoting factor, HPF/YfiA family n=1 Tax=Sphingosinicella sp. LHD-64 TaxID=3072139 RepID=UPI00280CAD44|nr:ribosome-associated translation inhibitor RaiA [Sphingosinicella sp. LHD-64]MDQ8757020.1 ribosome-associated translation inhibitor RaiA [Sphingosinicella sp. LHD-64]
MDIRVSGHQIETGEALQAQVDQRLGGIADKYFARAISAQVTFGKGPYDHSFTCDIVAHVPQGVVLKGRGAAADARNAFDQAADRIETQLRRYKRRLKDRHAQTARAEADDGAALDAGYTIFAPPSEAEEPVDNPPVVAETRVDIPSSSVSDAVMLLDLRNTNALMFRNSGTGLFNMVYRRGDGTIGWVEPKGD